MTAIRPLMQDARIPQRVGCQPVLPCTALRAGDNIVAAFACGTELALWRTGDGRAQAWENRCPHRSVRLSLGQVVGDRLSCAYHGWQYAAGSGACVGVPAHLGTKPPARVCTTTFPVVEAGGMVWVCFDGQPPPLALPAAGTFCRSLALRAQAACVRNQLVDLGWRENGASWNGVLGDVGAHAYFLDAQPGRTVLHFWLESADRMRGAHAAARALRAAIEGATP